MYTRNWLRTVTITRPANTTAYADGDGVSTTAGDVLELYGVAAVAGGGGRIKTVYIHKTSQNTANADFDLYFFDTTFAIGGIDDNAAIAITDAEFQTGIGFISIVAADWRNVVTGDVYCKTNIDLHYECAATDTALYAGLVARGPYVPASAEVFTIRVGGEVN